MIASRSRSTDEGEQFTVMPQPRRRWAFFPRSVISDHGNPAAHLYRAMARTVDALDDEARFYEERANQWLRGMLTEQGAQSLRTFQERHPEITYVTYEPRTGHRLAEWLSLALATVDIVVVDIDAPPTITQWIGELTSPRLNTFLLDPEGTLDSTSEIPEYVRYYRAICTSSTSSGARLHESARELIPFGPALPVPGENGNATRHIDTAAEELVRRLVQTSDTAIGEQQDLNSGNEGGSR